MAHRLCAPVDLCAGASRVRSARSFVSAYYIWGGATTYRPAVRQPDGPGEVRPGRVSREASGMPVRAGCEVAGLLPGRRWVDFGDIAIDLGL
jgi:hypothetical protein